MPLTTAERQAAFRKRRAELVTQLRDELADARERLVVAEAERATALAELERLSSSQCRHPAGLVDGGRCHACGAAVW
jgi:N-methylhydantoinase A/oxoprolinase/acetone carboxylase beta subunit